MSTYLAASPALIEFTGLPGAGKTTLGHKLVELLNLQGIHCHASTPLRDLSAGNAKPRAQLVSDLAIKRREFLKHAWEWSRSSDPRIPFRRLRAIVNAPFWLSYRMRRGEDVVVLEEGPVHKLWRECMRASVQAPGNPHLLLRSIYKDVDGPVIFVHLDIDSRIAAERVVARGQNAAWFRGRSISEIEEAFARVSALTRTFTDAAVNAIDARVVMLDGMIEPSANAEAIVAALKEVAWSEQSRAV